MLFVMTEEARHAPEWVVAKQKSYSLRAVAWRWMDFFWRMLPALPLLIRSWRGNGRLSPTLRLEIVLCLIVLGYLWFAVKGWTRSRPYRRAADLLAGAIVRYEVADDAAEADLERADLAATNILQGRQSLPSRFFANGQAAPPPA